MRILVTGGAGFIGSHVAEAALARGHEVAVLDDLSHGKRQNVPATAAFFACDVRDSTAVNAVFTEFRPDCVSHQAAQASVSVSVREPAFDAEVNILGTLRLLDACVRFAVRRFVLASTGGAIYGEVAADQAASEDWPARPYSPYALSKFAAEGYLGIAHRQHHLETTVLRYANVYGPRQDAHGEAGVVAIFLARLRRGEPLRVNAAGQAGDAGCVRDYVYVEDVVRANLLALEGTLAQPLLNVGTGIGTTTLSLAQRLTALAGAQGEPERVGPRAGDLQRSVLDARRCQQAIGALTPLADGLAATAAWFDKAFDQGFNKALDA